MRYMLPDEFILLGHRLSPRTCNVHIYNRARVCTVFWTWQPRNI